MALQGGGVRPGGAIAGVQALSASGPEARVEPDWDLIHVRVHVPLLGEALARLRLRVVAVRELGVVKRVRPRSGDEGRGGGERWRSNRSLWRHIRRDQQRIR